MESTAATFKENAKQALADAKLRDALAKLSDGFPVKRRDAAARLPESNARCRSPVLQAIMMGGAGSTGHHDGRRRFYTPS